MPFILEHQEKLCFPTSDGYLFLRIDDITYIKSDDIYSYIHNGTTKHFSTQSLKLLMEQLPEDQFIRCHRSYIVNTCKVFKLIKSGNCKLIMENGDEVPVARGKKEETTKKLINKTYKL